MEKERKNKRTRQQKMVSVVCLLCVLLMLIGTVSSAFAEIRYIDKSGNTKVVSDFLDTGKHPSRQVIKKWAEYGVISGSNGKFYPNNPIKRGDFAGVLERFMGLYEVSFNNFVDVPTESYYRDAILKAVGEQYIKGVSTNRFNPKGYMTREEMAVIMARVFALDTSVANTSTYGDNHKISNWARSSVATLQKKGFLPTMKYFRPKDKATRAEVVEIFNSLAEVYIPQKDIAGLGGDFNVSTSRNVVIARGVAIKQGSIGGDLILTQSAKSVELSNVKVQGITRVLGLSSLELKDSSLGRVELNRKSNLTGIGSSKVQEIVLSARATDTTLDQIPDKLEVASGVRFSVAGRKYVNDTGRVKIYTSDDIKQEIATEQGYVEGGPKIKVGSFVQYINNDIELKDIIITKGKNNVREVGYIYLQADKYNTPPTLQDYDKKESTRSFKVGETFNFMEGEVDRKAIYRPYVIDTEGLVGYGDVVTKDEYDFRVTHRLYEETNGKMKFELEFKGDNIPKIQTVQGLYSFDGRYSDTLPVLSMSEVTSNDKYGNKRTDLLVYSGEMTLAKDSAGVIQKPKQWGYAVTYATGEKKQEFPISTSAEKYLPVVVTTGIGEVIGNELQVKDSVLESKTSKVTDYGVVYSTTENIPNKGWRKESTFKEIKENVKDNYTLRFSLPNSGEVLQYAAYAEVDGVVTYGEVKQVKLDMQGTPNGPQVGNVEVLNLGTGVTVLGIPVQLTAEIDKTQSIFTTFAGYENTALSSMVHSISPVQDKLTVAITGLTKGVHPMSLRIFDTLGGYSNKYQTQVDTTSFVPINVVTKGLVGRDTIYNVTYDPRLSGRVEIVNVTSSLPVNVMGNTDNNIIVRDIGKANNIPVTVTYRYYISRSVGDIQTLEFTRTLILP